MDPAAEEQLDYGDEDYGGAQKTQYQGGGAIPALAEEELMGEDDDYEDLYDGVNVGESFMKFHRPEAPGSSNNLENGSVQAQIYSVPEPKRDSTASKMGNPGVPSDGRDMEVKAPEMRSVNHITGPPVASQMVTPDSGNMGSQGPASMAPKAVVNITDTSKATNLNIGGPSVHQEMENNQIAVNAKMSNNTMVSDNIMRQQMESGPTTLFVGELHWWTTDAELESVLLQYGKVKEIKFFDERASGKSKGYCQVEFYDPSSAATCKEKMNGYMFNGRACVVAFASPQTLRQMGAGYANKPQPQSQSQPQPQPQPVSQGRRFVNDGGGRGGGMNYPAGDGGRNYGRGGWGRGGQGGPARGPGGGGPRGRGGQMGGPRNSFGNASGVGNGVVGNFGQGLVGPAFGGAGGGMVHPQAMMGPGFDLSYMGRGAGFGGFPGMMPPFPAVNPMGLAGVAPHVNPAFFGRGMAPNGMGMMSTTGMDGHPGGMWTDPSMGGWGGEEHGQRTRESSYIGDDGASDYGYGEANPEKGARPNSAQWEKERVSERRYRDDREQDWDRSDREPRYREEKDGYRDHRHKEHDSGYEDDRDKGQSSSRSRSRSRAMPEDDHRSRSRDVDYGKRRRAPSE